MMLTARLLVLLVVIVVVGADCGCGGRCVAYSDASKCARCCTAAVKRSLPNPFYAALAPEETESFDAPSLHSRVRSPLNRRRPSDDVRLQTVVLAEILAELRAELQHRPRHFVIAD